MYYTRKHHAYNHPDVNNDTIPTHKHFLIDFVNSLIRRGNIETRMPIVTQGVATAPNQDPSIVHKGTTGKLVMRRNKPSLPIFDDLRYCPGVHELVPAGKQNKCKYCQYLVLVFKNRKEAPPVEKQPSWHQCNICNVHLCKDHFNSLCANGAPRSPIPYQLKE